MKTIDKITKLYYTVSKRQFSDRKPRTEQHGPH